MRKRVSRIRTLTECLINSQDTLNLRIIVSIRMPAETSKDLPLPLFRQLAVIFLGFVTTGLTAAAIVGFFKFYGQLPVSKRHGLPDVLRRALA